MAQEPLLNQFAKHNRRDMTAAEWRLWQDLRDAQLGYRFRRQDPIGPFIADFCCRNRRLVIEVDGDAHENSAKDRSRDHWFAHHGWFILRFDNEDILDHPDETLALIAQALHDPASIQDPWNEDS
ncbi:MAG: endonuclease domain-containing protein [Acidimicrobiia bacterium]